MFRYIEKDNALTLIKDKKASEYDSAYSSKLWLFENVTEDEYISYSEAIKEAGIDFVGTDKADIKEKICHTVSNCFAKYGCGC